MMLVLYVKVLIYSIYWGHGVLKAEVGSAIFLGCALLLECYLFLYVR